MQNHRTPDLIELFRAGTVYASGPRADAAAVRRIISFMPPFATATAVFAHAVTALDKTVDDAFASGWLPAELMHVTRRQLGARPARLVSELVGSHSARTNAHSRAPVEWTDHLRDMGIEPFSADTRTRLADWNSRDKGTDAEVWHTVLAVVGLVGSLSPLPVIVPTPDRWGDKTPNRVRPDEHPEPKMLIRIRALLAKAESTTFTEEADAFAAKAQELMSRYSIDEAMIDEREARSPNDRIITRRILIENPYPEAKIALLGAVTRVNGAQVLWHKSAGLASIVGMPVDLDLCELLFTSLLVQSAQGLRSYPNTPAAFRRSFLLSYSHRVFERLNAVSTEARAAATTTYGRDLVPVLAKRADAVRHAFDALFPQQREIRMSSSNHAGAAAGRHAADIADLTGGRDPLDKRRGRLGNSA